VDGPATQTRIAPDPRSERGRLARLRAIVERARLGVGQLSDQELLELLQLYRFATSRIAWHETRQGNAALLADARNLARAAHALLYRGIDRPREGWLRRTAQFFLVEVPRTVRAEWRLIAIGLAVVYGLAALAYVAVLRDLELAYSLLDPDMVAHEIRQLEETKAGEPFRGNFTFGIGESAQTAAMIMFHNMQVGVLFFAAALVPPIFLMILGTNSLMLGTYTAVASHWDQGAEISSILWCHGTLEIQAIVLAGVAGFMLIRGFLAPGPYTRRHAILRESSRAWRILAAVFPMLFCAGLIEGFVSPHLGLTARLSVAVVSGLLMILWLGFAGREQPAH